MRRGACALKRIVIHADRLALDLHADAIEPARLALSDMATADDGVRFEAALQLKRTQRARTLIASTSEAPPPRVDRALLRAIVAARRWAQELAAANAPSLRAIARREKVCPSYARQVLPLAFLAPDLVEAVLEGRQPPSLSLAAPIAQPLPAPWRAQRDLFSRFA